MILSFKFFEFEGKKSFSYFQYYFIILKLLNKYNNTYQASKMVNTIITKALFKRFCKIPNIEQGSLSII